MSEDVIQQIVDGLADKGLAVVPANLVEPAMTLQKARERILKRSKITPYEIEKFKLLPGAPTQNTVKNMVKDGRITDNEWFRDRTGKIYITRACINRLNNEG